ncbi:MAG: hypothetical protein ACYCZN_01310 [Candidatus Dormibacteria bacterium]
MTVGTAQEGRNARGVSAVFVQGNAELGRLAGAIREMAEEHGRMCDLCQAGKECRSVAILSQCAAKLRQERRQVLDHVAECSRWGWPR